jgi:hypothetical protein
VRAEGRRNLKGGQLIAASQLGAIVMGQLWAARIALRPRDPAANGRLSR